MHILKLTSSIPLFSLLQAFFLLQSSASLFPVSQLSSTVEELHLLGSERPSERKIHLHNLPLLAFLSFFWKEFDRVAGEQKHMHYIIFDQSQLKDLNCHVFPPTFCQIWQSRFTMFVAMVDKENRIEFYAFLCFAFGSQRLVFSISFQYLHFIREFVEDFCSLFVSSRARFLQTRLENMFVAAER